MYHFLLVDGINSSALSRHLLEILEEYFLTTTRNTINHRREKSQEMIVKRCKKLKLVKKNCLKNGKNNHEIFFSKGNLSTPCRLTSSHGNEREYTSPVGGLCVI